MMGNKTKRAYDILEGNASDRSARFLQYFITVLIVTNVVFVIIETEKSVLDHYGYLFTPFEVFSVIVFTTEYAVRIIVCKMNPKYKTSRYARLRLAMTPLMLVDLIAILPFFISFVVPTVDTRFVRVIRMLRLFRLFKLARYSESMQLLGDVLKAKIGDLTVAFFILFLVLIFASYLMYNAEHDAQPDVFSSIPSAMWWGIITLTTIGYGDTFPVTVLGKVIGATIAIIGIAVYAIPTGIIASAFVEELRKKRNMGNNCPHCGKEIR